LAQGVAAGRLESQHAGSEAEQLPARERPRQVARQVDNEQTRERLHQTKLLDSLSFARPDKGAGRQASGASRRGGAGLRSEGLPRCAGRLHRRGGRGRLRPALPLLLVEGRGAARRLPRDLARPDRNDRRIADRVGARTAARLGRGCRPGGAHRGRDRLRRPRARARGRSSLMATTPASHALVALPPVRRRLLWTLGSGAFGLAFSITTISVALPPLLHKFTDSGSLIGLAIGAEGFFALTLSP